MLQGAPQVQAPLHPSSRVTPPEGALQPNAALGLLTPDKIDEGDDKASSIEGGIELSQSTPAGGEEFASSGGEDLQYHQGGRNFKGEY